MASWLEALNSRAASTEDGLQTVQKSPNQQGKVIAEMDEKWAQRMDHVQAQVVELQKQCASPMAPSPSPHGRQVSYSLSAGDHPLAPSMFVIVGGWKDGERRLWKPQGSSRRFARLR